MTQVGKKRRRAAPPAARPTSRAEQKQDTRERIREAAWHLFTTVGYEATTTKAIARRAGVASGTVFVHASDKQDLLFLVMHDVLSSAVERLLSSLPSARLVDRWLHLFGGFFALYAEHPDVARAFVAALPGGKGPNAQRMAAMTYAFWHRLATLVIEAQRRGEVASDVDALVAAHNAFAAYYMSLLGWISGVATLDTALHTTLTCALEQQFRGLAARAPQRRRVKGSRPA